MHCCSKNCNEIADHEVVFKFINKNGYCCDKHLREFKKDSLIAKIIVPVSVIAR